MNMQAQKVSIDSCRNMAIHNNKAIKVADEGITGAGYLKKAAQAAYLPGIDFGMMYMYNQRTINLLGADAKLPTMTFNPLTQKYDYNILVNPADGKPVVDPATGTPIPTEVAVIPKEAMSYDIHNVVAGAVTLTQPVYMGGQIRAMNEITKYAEQMAISQRNSKIQDIVYKVDENYWMVVSLKQKQKLAKSYLNLVDSLQHSVELMLQEGVATRSDLLSVQVKRNEAEIMLTKVDNGLSLSRMALSQVCGLPVNIVFELQDEDLDEVRVPVRLTAGAENMEDVYSRRYDLQTLRTSISIFEQQEKIALGDMLPKVGIVAAYSFSNPNVIDGFEKRFGGGFSVGASLTIPIWHWGGNYNKLRAARSATTAQRLLLEDTYDMVTLQVNQARYKYDEAFKTYNMTISNMKKADENLRQAHLGFREGVLTTNDVMAAQTAWVQAGSEKIDAEIGIRLCKVYLDKVLGLNIY